MKIIFSRKGFDSASGGAPSPIVEGRPVSLPIPAEGNSVSSYGDLGLGDLVAKATRGRLGAEDLCHADPFFRGGRCAFGQHGAAQGHLRNQGVGIGDTFLFFGLFADPATGERHHRIFGFLQVEQVVELGRLPVPAAPIGGTAHPHTLGEWDANNVLYLGQGGCAGDASDALRLTVPGGPLTLWAIPEALAGCGMSYHARPDRWRVPGRLTVAGRWQEGVVDISGSAEMRTWLAEILERLAPGASG
ncbi:hypothetical protein CLV78_102682 [Aliiruegeria haliotis]|uniref:Nucleotide modification associated domain-containing protein n=1 Tax=Aliiruegeria haliotis TaxID=1280846 RepID=A0A2T0RWK1_9RHOB|nr:hypothetical protein [Aliiruegeria haliotis]PRY25502.1 hypothetical protein CLV78_102682 [Aliiruegeria haliotis]